LHEYCPSGEQIFIEMETLMRFKCLGVDDGEQNAETCMAMIYNLIGIILYIQQTTKYLILIKLKSTTMPILN
jgi:hypothetical protein